MRLVLDTSALLSLEAGKVLDLVIDNFELIIPRRVEEELNGISKNHDFEGNLAKRIVSFLENEIKIIESSKSSEEGELECAYLANDLKDADFLITDDIVALKRLEKICKKKIRFSTMLLYALTLKDKLSKKQAIIILERMRVKRNWKDNIIFEKAKMLLETAD